MILIELAHVGSTSHADSHFLFSITAHPASQRPLPSPNREPMVDEKQSEACKMCFAEVRWGGGWGAISDDVMTGHVVVLLHKQTKL